MGFDQFSPEFLKNFGHLDKRVNNSLAQSFIALSPEDTGPLPSALKSFFFLSSTDTGVILNGGRRGAAFGPLALLNVLKKASLPAGDTFLASFATIEVSSSKKERENFAKAQKEEAEVIARFLKMLNLYGPNLKPHWHLGGGNDHIYPLVLGLLKQKEVKEITVLNLDPHLDTRQDPLFHSGTPFRQLSEASKEQQKKINLIQWGTKAFANPSSNFELDNHPHFNMTIWNDKKGPLKNYLKSLPPLDEGHFLLLGLDCDVLNSSLMSAVSAPAWQGVELAQVEDLFYAYLELTQKNHLRPIIGIYEFNPLYEDLSQKGARSLGALIHSAFLKNCD